MYTQSTSQLLCFFAFPASLLPCLLPGVLWSSPGWRQLQQQTVELWAPTEGGREGNGGGMMMMMGERVDAKMKRQSYIVRLEGGLLFLLTRFWSLPRQKQRRRACGVEDRLFSIPRARISSVLMLRRPAAMQLKLLYLCPWRWGQYRGGGVVSKQPGSSSMQEDEWVEDGVKVLCELGESE